MVDLSFAKSVSAAGFRKLAADHLCRHFDRHGAVPTFDHLEDARQKLVIVLAQKSHDGLAGDVGALAKLIDGARNGDTIEKTVELIRADFGAGRREKLQDAGWVV